MALAEPESGALVRLDILPAAAAAAMEPLPALWRGHVLDWSRPALLRPLAEQIEGYFAGSLTRFTVPLAPQGGGAFDREVWAAMPDLVPFGRTMSYGALAAALGRPKAARAVGRANATNPLCLVMPCHRILSSTGALHGYGSGEGLATKQALLAHEAAVFSRLKAA